MLFKPFYDRALTQPPVRSNKKQMAMYPSAASLVYKDPETGVVEVAGACLRKEWYRITGEVPTEAVSDADSAGIMKMEAGVPLQALVERAFQTAGLWRASETAFYHEKMNLSGRVDFWLVDPTTIGSGGREVLVPCECKTVGKYVEAGCCIPKDGKMMPKIEHLLQVIPYLDYYGQWAPTKLCIFYLCRESMELGEHLVWLEGDGQYMGNLSEERRHVVVQNATGTYPLEHITVRGVYERYYELSKAARSKVEPPADFVDQWDNAKLVAYARNGRLNKTDTKKVLDAVRANPAIEQDTANPVLQRGDWQCRYCEFYARCRTGIRHMAQPFLRDVPQKELTAAPAPVVDDFELL